jgi:hypothetical protein
VTSFALALRVGGWRDVLAKLARARLAEYFAGDIVISAITLAELK